MLLNLEDSSVPMKRVYLLSEELGHDPNRVALAQELTLDARRPSLGLKGTHGLFGSEKWWANIREKKIPLLFISGIIQRAYVAGQDSETINNTIDVVLDDGSITSVGIYTNEIDDINLFCSGRKIDIVYALDELKRQPAGNGGVNYSRIALEMAVSWK